MKLNEELKRKIDEYFDRISPQELYEKLKKYELINKNKKKIIIFCNF